MWGDDVVHQQDLNASLTLYVATSSSSSTLLRTREEIIDLDYRASPSFLSLRFK
jgi:hypothetical protein